MVVLSPRGLLRLVIHFAGFSLAGIPWRFFFFWAVVVSPRLWFFFPPVVRAFR